MKKYILILVIISVISVFTSRCGETAAPSTKYRASSYTSYVPDYMNSEYYIFDHAEHIVKAKLIDVGSWGGAAVYEFKVKKEYFGKLSETSIHVCDGDYDKYKPGKKYFLFLCNDGDLGTGYDIYKSTSNHIVFPANKRVYQYGYHKWYTLKRSDIPDMIEKASATREEREIAEFNKLFVSENSCAGDAAKEAEEVALITVEEKLLPDKMDKLYISSYRITTEEVFAGSADYIAPRLYYAGELETGKSYILMTKPNKNTFRHEIFDKNYSLIEATEENIAEVTDALKSNNT